MSNVTELGYIGIGIKNVPGWKSYATEIVGMELVDEGEGDRFYLRMDNWHHRIVVHLDGSDDLAYLGWRVPGPSELDAMEKKLADAGLKVRRATDKEAEERRVLGLLKLQDPGGNPTEIFYGPLVDTMKPFHPGRPMHGRFVTGSQGIGHCIVREDDVMAAHKFYTLLGMVGSIEYKFPLPNGMTATPVFMHCNERQHSVAFGVGPMQKRINHLMIEYTALDDLGMAHSEIRRRQIDVALQLGKHSNDEALTFYAANPSAWLWELGWGGRKAPSQQEYYRGDIFGHGVEVPGYGVDVKLD